MSIYKKLIEVQNELKAPKGQYNEFGKYSYRKADDILEAVKPLLEARGLGILLSDKTISLGEKTVKKSNTAMQGHSEKTQKIDGEMVVVKVPSFDKSSEVETQGFEVVIEATARIFDEEGVTIEVTAQAGVEAAGGMQLPQAYGSASSYARKYAMSGLFAIDDERDSDDENRHGKAKPDTSQKEGKESPAKPENGKPKGRPKPVMEPSYKGWKAAVKFVSEGGDIDSGVAEKYQLSDANRAKLIAEAEKVK